MLLSVNNNTEVALLLLSIIGELSFLEIVFFFFFFFFFFGDENVFKVCAVLLMGH